MEAVQLRALHLYVRLHVSHVTNLTNLTKQKGKY